MSEAKIVFTAADRTAAAVASVKKGLGTVSEAAASAGINLATLAAAGTLAGFVAMVKSVNDSVDALNDLKDATGSSIENISALESVARRHGHSFDTVGGALTKFNQALAQTEKPGSDVERVLKAIGLNAKTLRDLDPAESMLRTAVAFEQFADDGNKARAAQELFSKSLREVSPFLKDLAEQGRLNATVTTQQAEEAEKFNRQLTMMNASLQDVGRALTSDFVQGINAAAKAWKESGLVEAFRTFFTGDDQHKNNVRLVELTDQLLQAENRLAASRKRDSRFGDRSLETAAAERALAAIKAQLAVVQSYQSMLTSTMPEAPKASIAVAPEPDKKAIAAAKKELEDQAKIVAELSGLTASFAEDWDRLNRMFAAGKLSLTQLTQAQEQLLAKQPGVKQAHDERIRLAKLEAETLAEWAEEAERAYLADSKAREQFAVQVGAQARALDEVAESLRLEASLIGQTDQVRQASLASLRIEQNLRKQLAELDSNLAFDEGQRNIERARLRENAAREKGLAQQRAALDEQLRIWDSIDSTAHDVFVNILDGGSNVFKKLGQTLKASVLDLLYQMQVRPFLINVVANVTGQGGALAGMTGGGGGLGSLLNTGSSLLGNFGGIGSIGATLSSASYAAAVPGLTSFGAGSQAAMLAAQTSGFGAAGLGATASAGGSALGGAIGSLGAAMPYIGAAVVAAMVAKQLFDQGGGPKSEGAAGTLGMLSELGVRGSSDARSRQSANAARASISDQYAQLAAMYGIRDKFSFGVGFSADPEGNAPSFAEVTATRGGKVVHSTGSANLARGEEAMAINLADFSAKTMLKALQDSGLKDGIGEYLRELGDIDKLSRGSTTNALARIQKAGAEKQALEERMFALTATSAQQLARARKQELSGLDETNRAMLKRIHSLEDEAVATAQRQTLEDRYAQLSMNAAQLLARDRKREIAETDKSNVSLLKRIYKLEDERAAQEKASESIAAAAQSSRAAAQYLSDLKTSLGQYIDQLKGGPGGMLAPEQQLSNAKSQFERQLKLARGGDREALGSITSYADQLIEAQTQWTASGPQTAKIIAYVMEQLAKLPKSVDKKALAQVPAYADGGDHAGGYAWVGERGPELAFFRQPATIYPAERSRSMAGGDADLVAKVGELSRQVEGLTRVVASYAQRDLAIGAAVARNTAGSRPQQILATVRGGGR